MKKKIDFGFHPSPKPPKKEKKVDTKLKPYMKKRPKKAKREKNPLKKEIHRDRLIPLKQQRGRITTAEYNEAARRIGYECYVCGCQTNLEAHHVKFRSNSGRGTFRNIRFLCNEHHRGDYSPHQNEALRKELETLHESLYGKYYFCDKYDLFQMGLIDDVIDNDFEKFMESEEREND